MADKKISELTEKTTIALDDLLALVDSEATPVETKKVTLRTIFNSTVNKNGITNGSFRVAQRGTSFTAATTPANNDDTFLLDEWILLSDGNDVVDVSKVVRATPNGSYAECKLEVETANKQFGILHILRAVNAARFIGQTVSVSFKARMAAADDNTHSLKCVVLSWDGTADTVTSDVVNAWSATPSYVANWTAENTPSSQTLTTTEQTFKVEGISIDTASTKNIAVFIFCDQTDGAVDDAVIITDVQLELGSVATQYEYIPYADEFFVCRKSRNQFIVGLGRQSSDIKVYGHQLLIPDMWGTPTIVISAANIITIWSGAGSGASTGIANNSSNYRDLSLAINMGALGAAGDCVDMQLASGYIWATSEL